MDDMDVEAVVRPNILFITLDQFRGDCLSGAGHPVVQTPNLDRLAASGVRLARHYSQASPCAPGRASLYTGTYQMNHRVVGNGSPLDDRFDNVARAARRAGCLADPIVFTVCYGGVEFHRFHSDTVRAGGVNPFFHHQVVHGNPGDIT